MNEERIVDIELKLTSHEDLLDTLNKTVYEQQRKIEELEALCTALVHRLVELREATAQTPLNEPPPHY
ncbi:MAG: SlyX family protein [Oxalicibacterium faecigallinarum]|uniref:SlyX family protein n=1 Tax=Oxalicibacterium faecigallinarum TaxID=573741 RepID=UPI002807381A|nr:SlyX family protein [Oxalicibacterium faecigallinarum]MDQ7968089.1 SlyX family protein [Oxalicibacterium faecigallinarum]